MSAYREYRRLKEDHKKFEGQYMKRDAEALKQYLERRNVPERIPRILHRMERPQQNYVRDDRRME